MQHSQEQQFGATRSQSQATLIIFNNKLSTVFLGKDHLKSFNFYIIAISI